MISLIELEKQLDLSKYERNLGNKRTKAGKYFWRFVLFHYRSVIWGMVKPELQMIIEEYSNVFYRRYKVYPNLLKNYDGKPTDILGKELNVDSAKEIFSNKIRENLEKLEEALVGWLKNQEDLAPGLDPKTAQYEKHDLSFFDHRHPELPKLSESYKKILSEAGYTYEGDEVKIDRRWKLTPSEVKEFSQLMDKVLRYEYMINITDHLQDYLDTTFKTFYSKTRKKGATDALYDVLSNTPQMAEYSDKRLKYHLMLEYCKPNGEDFEKGTVQKAVKRFRDE